MIPAARSVLGGWGWTYLRQLAAGRLSFPAPGDDGRPVHFVLVVANHFEPTWHGRSHAEGLRLLRRWCRELEAIGAKDADGHRFKHTYFFPAEQYHPDFLDALADHCRAGFGEVEVHLHHGLEAPDTAKSVEATLREFVDRLLEHGCLGRDRASGSVGYCFVHGDFELANCGRGKACGVDSEMVVLERTGCYLDCTMPSAPDPSQVPVINAVYTCGRPHEERAPHRRARPLARGARSLRLPVLLQGPLLIDWGRRRRGVPVPRLETGGLGAEAPPSPERFRLWARARVHVQGRPDWVFVKLHTHGLIERHQAALLGAPMRRTLDHLLAAYDDGRRYRIHFATAREAANMLFAAVDGHSGDPDRFRDYRFVRTED